MLEFLSLPCVCLLLKKKNYYMKVRFKVQNWIVVCFCIRIHFFLPCVCVYLFLINKFKKKKNLIYEGEVQGSKLYLGGEWESRTHDTEDWVSVWIQLPTSAFWHLAFSFFSFFLFRRAFHVIIHCSVGLMHYSRDPQTFLFSKNFIKNGSHDTIHTFKNYFTIVFLVFSKI